MPAIGSRSSDLHSIHIKGEAINASLVSLQYFGSCPNAKVPVQAFLVKAP